MVNIMKRKQKRKWLSAHKKIVALGISISGILLVWLIYDVTSLLIQNYTANQNSTLLMKDTLVRAAENLKKDVPVDPKTGDLYFPESRLYLPNPKSNLKFIYEWHPAERGSQEELSISILPIPGTSSLYAAIGFDGVVAASPKLQACGRGITLSYSKSTGGYADLGQLKKMINLQNGKELYLFQEKACPDLDEVVDILSKVTPY